MGAKFAVKFIRYVPPIAEMNACPPFSEGNYRSVRKDRPFAADAVV